MPLDPPPPSTEISAAPITRRGFLRRAVIGAVLLLSGGTVARHLSGYAAPPRARPLRNLSDKEAVVLGAIVARILDPGEGTAGAVAAPTPDSVDVIGHIDDYLAELPEGSVADLRALLHLVEHSPPVLSLHFGRFSRLSPASQDEVLAGWESSGLALRRLAFVALKRVAMVGYYGDPRAFAVLGYSLPAPAGPRP